MKRPLQALAIGILLSAGGLFPTVASAAWIYQADAQNPRLEGEVIGTLAISHGESVQLFIDCYQKPLTVQLGYSSNFTERPNPQRSVASRYMAGIQVPSPQLVSLQREQVTSRTSWNSADGGFGKVSLDVMKLWFAADRLEVRGGREIFQFSTSDLRVSATKLMRRCNLL